MKKILAALFILLGVASPSLAASSLSPRVGVLLMSTGTTNWGTKLNDSVFSVFDASVAVQAKTNTFVASNTFTAPILVSGANLQLTGSAGYLAGASSITASSFFGNGAALTGIPSTSSIVGVYVRKDGDQMSNSLTISGGGVSAATGTFSTSITAPSILNTTNITNATASPVTFTNTNGQGFVFAPTSGTNFLTMNGTTRNASFPYGVSSGSSAVSGLSTTANLIVSSTATVQGNAFSVGGSTFVIGGGSATVAYSVTAQSFYGDGSHLSGIPSTGSLTGSYYAKTGGPITGGVAVGTVTIDGDGILVQGPGGSGSWGSYGIGMNGLINANGNITSDLGRLGAGTSSPVYPLHAVGTAYATGQGIFGGTMTVQGNAFSVGGSTFVVSGGSATVGGPAMVRGILSLNPASVPEIDFLEGGTARGYAYYSTNVMKFNRSGSINAGISVDVSDNVGIGTASPATTFDVAGSAKIGTSGTIITQISTGTYTPTLTLVTNIASTNTVVDAQYTRVGNIVTVYGQFEADATIESNTASQIDISLPIASDFTASSDARGVGVTQGTVAGPGDVMRADVTNNRINYFYYAQAASGNTAHYFTFMYTIK